MSADVVQAVFIAIITLILAGMGVYMVATGNVKLLHGYHYASVPASERPRLARETGAGLIAAGAGIALAGMATTLVSGAMANVCTMAGLILLIASIAWMLVAIVRRGGSLVPTAAAPFGGMAADPRLGMLFGGALGAVIALATGAPGVYMIATGDPGLLHSYHRAGVAAADLPLLASIEGAGMIALAVGVFVCMLAGGRMVARPAPLWAKVLMGAGCALWIVGIAAMLIAIPALGGSLAP